MKSWLVSLALLTQLGCTTTQSKSSKESTYHMEKVWYQGGMDNALKLSKAQNKPLFVYWGAVWCPPCNEIKDQVFSRSRFGELMGQFIPVYLDGDSEEAQIWADRLQAYGYPTILVLSPEGKEMLRLSGGVNLEEFELALAGAQNRSLDELVEKARSGKLDREGWQAISFISWGQLPEDQYPAKTIWAIQRDLLDSMPRGLQRERAVLIADFLGLSSRLAQEESPVEGLDDVRREAPQLLDGVFSSEQTVLATRGFINSSGVDVLSWAFSSESSAYDSWKKRWLWAAQVIRSSKRVSVDTRLWAIYPLIQFHKDEQPKKAAPEALKAQVVAAAQQADLEATSSYERHSVISGAAYLMRLVEAYDQAERLLKKELAQTDTPWYYQSSLSSLAAAQDKDQEALYWSAEARKSAQGRASRLQWITSDLLLTAKVESQDQRERLLFLAKEFYQLATDLKDGFAGRNQFRAARVGKSLQAWKNDKGFQSLFKGYQSRCQNLSGVAQDNCIKHFEELI
ncbi:protein disulfide-isomerase [Pseudobacteriovorax antillogorgiicola]|uniref:Protein disulfide-isomerase n=2 Tax=Pseudobacteriovorax antillogorgiicola TaxID=1513793 RepID=A0A1Y6BY30_9BACT|nr:protein disulfide-isomerase [Pseudobacteriovorax antillogorgiicola]SMF34043.1 protein disulfide-isomerase [Pseudobacteriovorax antillogorgiicola]